MTWDVNILIQARFIEDMSKALGVESLRVEILSCRAGSLIVDTHIICLPGSDDVFMMKSSVESVCNKTETFLDHSIFGSVTLIDLPQIKVAHVSAVTLKATADAAAPAEGKVRTSTTMSNVKVSQLKDTTEKARTMADSPTPRYNQTIETPSKVEAEVDVNAESEDEKSLNEAEMTRATTTESDVKVGHQAEDSTEMVDDDQIIEASLETEGEADEKLESIDKESLVIKESKLLPLHVETKTFFGDPSILNQDLLKTDTAALMINESNLHDKLSEASDLTYLQAQVKPNEAVATNIQTAKVTESPEDEEKSSCLKEVKEEQLQQSVDNVMLPTERKQVENEEHDKSVDVIDSAIGREKKEVDFVPQMQIKIDEQKQPIKNNIKIERYS